MGTFLEGAGYTFILKTDNQLLTPLNLNGENEKSGHIYDRGTNWARADRCPLLLL